MAEENKTEMNFMEPNAPLWFELKGDVKYFLFKNIKRYFLPLGISFLLFLATICTLLPIGFFPNRFEIHLISLLINIVFTIFLFAPSVLSFIDLIVIDSMSEMNQQPLPTMKQLMINYFNACFAWILKIVTKNTRILKILFITFLVYIFLLLIVIIPSHFVKISAEPQYFSIFDQTIHFVKNNGLFENIKNFLSLASYFGIELFIVDTLTYLFFVIYGMFSFQFIIFRSSSLSFTYSSKEAKTIYNLAFRKNKWSFAAFFVGSYKFCLITFAALLAIFGVAFHFVFDNHVFIFVTTVSLSVAALYIVLPYFIKFSTDTNLSFADIFVEGTLLFTIKQSKKSESEDKVKIEMQLKKLENIYKLVKQDRKTVYKKYKQNKNKSSIEPFNPELTQAQEDALDQYFKDIEEEIDKMTKDND